MKSEIVKFTGDAGFWSPPEGSWEILSVRARLMGTWSGFFLSLLDGTDAVLWQDGFAYLPSSDMGITFGPGALVSSNVDADGVEWMGSVWTYPLAIEYPYKLRLRNAVAGGSTVNSEMAIAYRPAQGGAGGSGPVTVFSSYRMEGDDTAPPQTLALSAADVAYWLKMAGFGQVPPAPPPGSPPQKTMQPGGSKVKGGVKASGGVSGGVSGGNQGNAPGQGSGIAGREFMVGSKAQLKNSVIPGVIRRTKADPTGQQGRKGIIGPP